MLLMVARYRLRNVVASLIATAALFAAPPLHAETAPAALPQGWASDESTAPSSNGVTAEATAAPVEPASGPAPANPPVDDYADADPRALEDFREPLGRYGAWVDDPTYGTVWIPSSAAVGHDFAPYQTAGHWVEDDAGAWVWVSDYDWGYIPFHYGRWVWIDGAGWAWIPGRTYAPAWVTWRVGAYGYIGWAPYPPSYYWWGGYPVSFWARPSVAYVFVPTAYVFAPNVHTYVIHDHAGIQAAAARTQPYKPAQPHAGASLAPAGAHASHAPASPSRAQAHIPSSAAIARGSADARAVALARPTASRGAAMADFQASRGSVTQTLHAPPGDWATRHGITQEQSHAMLAATRSPSHAFTGSDGRRYTGTSEAHGSPRPSTLGSSGHAGRSYSAPSWSSSSRGTMPSYSTHATAGAPASRPSSRSTPSSSSGSSFHGGSFGGSRGGGSHGGGHHR